MMAHSYFGYKEGYDVHHLNGCKTDNRLVNLMYLTREEHTKLHHTGKKLSDESKQKIRAAQKCKKVFCSELNKVFDSIHAAARELKLSVGNIHNCCNGKYKSTGGYHFSYYSGDSK